MGDSLWRSKWATLRQRAKSSGIEFKLTLQEYIELAGEADITDPRLIGRRSGEYCVGRVGDMGGYVKGNCRFITTNQNHLEKVLNGGQAMADAKNRGRTNSKVSDSLSGRTAETHRHVQVTAEANSKHFKVVSPDGVVYEGKNLNQFCKEHNLFQGPMSAICRGSMKKYKGWSGEYINGGK